MLNLMISTSFKPWFVYFGQNWVKPRYFALYLTENGNVFKNIAPPPPFHTRYPSYCNFISIVPLTLSIWFCMKGWNNALKNFSVFRYMLCNIAWFSSQFWPKYTDHCEKNVIIIKFSSILIKGKREVPRGVRNSKVWRQDKFRRDWSRH